MTAAQTAPASSSNDDRRGRVVVVGSLNMDLVARAPRLPKPGETLAGHAFAQVPGGKGGNQAVAAARLGAQVAMLGCIGDDPNGATLRQGLEAESIDCAALGTSASPTGVALIIVDDGSQNAIVIVAGSNADVTPQTIARNEALLATADVIVCQLETPPDTVRATLAAGRRLGKTTILNPAPAANALPDDWFALIDYLIPNELEAATLSGIEIATPDDARRAALALRQKGARNVIVTLGSQGVFALLGDGAGKHIGAPTVQAVDTTAAGDTFIGGFAAELARGRAVAAAIAFGQRAAAVAVTREGAQPSIPHRSEIAE
ncbi:MULTISPECIES: ribokinase [unclassified Caballeronia]|uniref:ribokinase n=1 Tax=unclassified Caballeronia TaxID=2646786 RepID=UPI0028545403|nr:MULTISPECIES: ribokinase [unclassified Caballeronia]MDR5750669.1 ribokinase [Caballeronia sp. LZ024]MDR5842298.1 ribokinase [Caballeronia sp. LZ031]